MFKSFPQGLHRLQSDEDGSQGEYDIGQRTFLKFYYVCLDLFLGDVCPHAEASQAGGVGEVAEEAGARQGVLPQAHRPRQDHTRPKDIVSKASKFPNMIRWCQIIFNNKYIFLSIPFHIVALRVKQFEQ